MTPSDWIKWREHLGITNAEAARRLGISKNMPAAYERGESPIPLYIALACAALAYGLPAWNICLQTVRDKFANLTKK
jgi:transcriptional regulator with XRE-family HTH domain